jgi:cysteine-S-conjugate beta-lyase
LTAVPVYPPFLTAPGHFRRNLVTVPLVLDRGRWRFDLEQLEQAVTPRTRLFLLCSPHNPVGRAFEPDELLGLAEICERHGIVICSDEIHCGLVLDRDKRHIPTAALSPEIATHTITLMAPSKTYNLPGLGCAFAVVSDPGLRRKFRAAMDGIVPHVNVMGLVAAEAAYRHGGEWLAALLDYLRQNRELVMERVNGMPGLVTTHVEATYLAWIDARGTGIDEPARFFEAAGVGLGNGEAFGGPGFLRLTFGCPRIILEEALDRMERALTAERQPLRSPGK